MQFKKMRKSLSEIRSLRKKVESTGKTGTGAGVTKEGTAADKAAVTSKADDKTAANAGKAEAAEEVEKKTIVLGKAILDPESNPCGLQEGFESFTPYKNLWVNITRYRIFIQVQLGPSHLLLRPRRRLVHQHLRDRRQGRLGSFFRQCRTYWQHRLGRYVGRRLQGQQVAGQERSHPQRLHQNIHSVRFPFFNFGFF